MNKTLPPHSPLDVKSELVQRALAQSDGWVPTDDEQAIELPLSFADPISLYAYIGTFAKLAAKQPVLGAQLVQLGGAVVVTLRDTKTFRGVTPAQLDFARLLSQQKETQAGQPLAERETTE